jgi:hypothetical protein
MRTTLILDDDVASQLSRFHRDRGGSFNDLMNEVLRVGLRHLLSPPPTRRAHVTKSGSLGGCLLASLDHVSESLALAEGENPLA